MVAVMASAEEVEADERPVHQGCMAGFLHLFDRPQVLSARRLHHTPRRLLPSSSGSATPSERSIQLDRATPSSPDTTPPAAPRPSLQLPPLDLNDGATGGGAAPSWRLPRLSLDSRAVVDGRGKYRPREIRTQAAAAAAPPSPSLSGAAADERRSPSVVARLMGLDALPRGHGDGDGDDRRRDAGELRRSASERVPRGDSSRFRFVDPAFFERPASPQQPPPRGEQQRPASTLAPSATETTAARRAQDPAVATRGIIQRLSRFDAREVFPEPAKRADPAVAACGGPGGEIALYCEIERRLRKRGIAEPARDLETLKQVLEALQLKGLLRHTAPPPPPQSRPAVLTTPPPPPIVVMRPSYRAPRFRDEADRAARRPRSPDPSPARSPASPARRGPQSPQRRVSPAQSPKQQLFFRKSSTFDASSARSRIARRAAQNSATLFPADEEASTTFSDGGSSGSSRWDSELPLQPSVLGDETSKKLERCSKLLSSIQAFTGGVDAAASDHQPSPVSVLDAASFLADEDSPSSSSGSKCAIDFNIIRRSPSPRKSTAANTASDPEDDEWVLGTCWPATVGLGPDPDYAYVATLVRLFRLHRKRDPADVYKLAEEQRRIRFARPGGGVGGNVNEDSLHYRRLLCGAVAEALDRQQCACPWDPVSWLRGGGELVNHVWAEIRRAREPVAAPADDEDDRDLSDVTRNAIRRDLSADDAAWASSTLRQRRPPGPEVADAVLQIERLVFKDLVADTIRELTDADRLLPRRKLVF